MEKQTINDILNMARDVKDIIEIKEDIKKIESAVYSPNYMTKARAVEEIYRAYPWINLVISTLPTTSPKICEPMTDTDYKHILCVQYKCLHAHETGKLKEFLEKY